MSGSGRKLHLRGGGEELLKSLSLVGEGARRAGMPAGRRESLESAAREACLAILECAQREGRSAPVEVEVSWDDHAVTVSFLYGGSGLDDLFDRAPLDPRLQAMRSAVDEVLYLRESKRTARRLSLRAHLLTRGTDDSRAPGAARSAKHARPGAGPARPPRKINRPGRTHGAAPTRAAR